MPVWWGIFAYSIFMAALGGVIYKNKKESATGTISFSSETDARSIGLFFALATFVLMAYFAGQRSYIFDSTDYQYAYDNYYTNDLGQITNIINGSNKGKGFAILLVLFKHFTNGTYNDWFTFLAVVQLVPVALFFYKYSTNYVFSVFLFITSGCMLWLVNGIRQFLAVAIILYFSDFIVKRKTIPFVIVILIAYYIHSSALLWLPFYFIIHYEPWSPKFLTLSVVFTVILFFLSNSSFLNDTEYAYLNDSLYRNGVNPVRVLVMSIPTIIAFVKRKEIGEKASPFINFCINLSVVCSECYIVGMFTSGIIGRLPIYFQLFSYLLLPWLLKNAFDEDTGKSITIACIIGFIAYFYYDMVINGNGVYNSTVLDLHYN